MKVIMISDMHISDKDNIKDIENKIDKMYEAVKDVILQNEEVVILSCGDIINIGQVHLYKKAEYIYDYIKEMFAKWQISFEFVPGNHDFDSENKNFDEFYNFTNKYKKDICNFSEKSTYSKNIEGINFIFTNSTLNGNIHNGDIVLDDILGCLDRSKDNILVLHHSFVNEDKTDRAAIGIQHLLIDNIKYILHGHTHGEKKFNFDDCTLIGVGAIHKTEENISNQFNLIDIENGKVLCIDNYWYFGDKEKFLLRENLVDNKEKYNKKFIGKKRYNFLDEYIERKIQSYDNGENINNNIEKTLYQVCKAEKNIVLLGDAGDGKTTELKHLAYQISNDDSRYYPIFIELDTYTNEEIEDFISVEYKDIDKDKIFFIIDGFDEIQSENLLTFARKINSYIKKNKDSIILISSRNNFYKHDYKKKNLGTFKGFKEYKLCEFTLDDIKNYLSKKELDYNDFYNQAKNNDIVNFLNNPFYLISLVKLYKESNKLPHKTSIMNDLIKNSFNFDNDKYTSTIDLEESEYKLNYTLEQLGFALQCTQKNYFTNGEYQELFDDKQREIIKYSGLWKKDEFSNWKFKHNNFKEYLAARYLSNKKLNNIIDVITYDINKKKVNKKWVNVLLHLLVLYKNNDLINWLIEVQSPLIIETEYDNIEVTKRTKLFIDIMNILKEKNMHISSYGDYYKIAKFGETKKALEYVLHEINNSQHLIGRLNAIVIIKNFSNTFGRKDEIKEALVKYCRNKKNEEYLISNAIQALSNLKINDDLVTEELIELFNDSNSLQIRSSMYYYLNKSNLYDRYIEYFIKGIEIYNSNNDNITDLGYINMICEGLGNITDYNSISKIFKFHLENKEFKLIYGYSSVFEKIIKKAEKLYLDGNKNIFYMVFKIYLLAVECYENNYINIIKKFFDNTKTVEQLYYEILNLYKYDKDLMYVVNLLGHIEDIMGDECLNDFKEKYENDKLKNNKLFIYFVKRLEKNENRFNKLCEVISKKGDIIITKDRSIDFDEINRKNGQIFFDALFCKDKFQKLIDEFRYISNDDATYKDITQISYELIEKKSYLNQVRWSFNKTFNNIKIRDLLDYINWNEFSIGNIYKILRDKYYKVDINEIQLDYIKKYCENVLNDIDINKEINYENEKCTVSVRLVYSVFLSSYFNIKLDKGIMINLLRCPKFLFYNGDKSNIDFSKYIYSNLTEEDIEIQVKENLVKENLEGEVAKTHLEYCINNNIDLAFELAKKVCVSKEGFLARDTAIKYLLGIGKEEYIYGQLLECCDDEMLSIIINNNYNKTNKLLEIKLIEKNKLSDNYLLYLKELISINSRYGLDKYIELVCKNNSIPDYKNDGKDITEAISQLMDKTLLPKIIELTRLLFKENFRDKPYLGLRNNLDKLFTNWGIQDFKLISNELNKLIKQNNNNLELVGFCNYILKDLEDKYYEKNDKYWAIEEVKQYLKTN